MAYIVSPIITVVVHDGYSDKFTCRIVHLISPLRANEDGGTPPPLIKSARHEHNHKVS